MKSEDYEYLIAQWKQLADNLLEVNNALRELVSAQQATILKLQGIQTVGDLSKKGEVWT